MKNCCACYNLTNNIVLKYMKSSFAVLKYTSTDNKRTEKLSMSPTNEINIKFCYYFCVDYEVSPNF